MRRRGRCVNADAHADRSSRDSTALPPIMVRLLDEHRRLDTVFSVFEQYTRQRMSHDPAQLDLLSCLADYVVEYPERVHHPREDLITEQLVDKGLTPGERVLVELTVSQHAELAGWTARIARDVDQMLAHGKRADERFRADVLAWIDLQRHHMRREEQQLFPLAIRLLSAEDWREIERSDTRVPDPVSESRLDRYRSLYDLVSSFKSSGADSGP